MPRKTKPTSYAAAVSGLAPVHSPSARLLILGSFPGVASLQARAYYAHPRNQFWPILASLLDEPLVALPYPARLERLRARGIAVWDVVDRCRRDGSLDTAIREAIANDFEPLLAKLPQLRAVAFNGRLAARSLPWFAARGYRTFSLPSSSPAHAGLTLERKREAWREAIATLQAPVIEKPPTGTPPLETPPLSPSTSALPQPARD